MKSAAPSPEPWQVLNDRPLVRNRMALVSTPNAVRAIDFTGSGESFAQDCANARLGAAAHDLLKALKHIERIAGSKGMTDADMQAALRDISEHARAVIKATGAQP